MRELCHPLNYFTAGRLAWTPLKMQSRFKVQRETFEQNINKKAKKKKVTGTEIKNEDTSACNSGGITNTSQN